MFNDLDHTLKSMLKRGAVPAELQAARVSFSAPDKNFRPQGSVVNLFLYEAEENRELRAAEPIVEKNGKSYQLQRSPLRVECSYIVTAWSDQNGAQKTRIEHRLLSLALAWLSRFPTIPAQYLHGALTNPTFPLPPTMVAQMDASKSTGEFWVALGIAPRPAFYLRVTIAMDLGVQERGPLVTTRTTSVQSIPSPRANAFVSLPEANEDWVQIGGRVVGLDGAGIAGALVDVLDAGLRTRTDDQGCYSFSRIPVGTRTIRAVATGFVPKNNVLTVPGLPDTYVVTLSPLPA